MLSQLGYNSFTVNMWAWFDESNARDVMFGNYNSTNNFNFEKLTNNNLRFYWNASPDISSSSNVIPIGQWCMLTVVRERISSTVSNIKMYVNGEKIHDGNSLSINDLTSLNGTLRLGRDYRTTNQAMKGKLDDVRFYMNALSDKDISDLYGVRAEIDESGVLYVKDIISNVEPVMNILSKVKNTRVEMVANHGQSTVYKWDINQTVMAGEEYIFSAEFFRNFPHDGRIYAMFRLVDSQGVLIPGNSGLISDWSATASEPLYRYFHTNIKNFR